MVRQLGPRERRGRVLRSPKVRLEGEHSACPYGTFAAYYATGRGLRLLDRIDEVLGVSSRVAAPFLALGLDQACARLPLDRLPEWVRASPLP